MESTSTWSYAAALPSVRVGFSAATLDNSLFVFGKDILYVSLFFLTASFFLGGTANDIDTNEILYYDSTADKWIPDGKMTEPKWSYGLGLVIDVSNVCP